MNKYLVILIAFFLLACNKNETNQNDYVDITYELQTNVTDFSQLKFGNFYSLSNGSSGVELEDWPVTGTGFFTKTVSIRKGYVAEVMGVHPTSGDWSLKIKSSTGDVLASGAPTFVADSNHYYLKITASSK